MAKQTRIKKEKLKKAKKGKSETKISEYLEDLIKLKRCGGWIIDSPNKKTTAIRTRRGFLFYIKNYNGITMVLQSYYYKLLQVTISYNNPKQSAKTSNPHQSP